VSDNIHKINVKIGGMNYQLLAAENESYMRQVAAHADEMIRRVMQNNPNLNLNMATILALVNAVDEQRHAFLQQLNAEKKADEAVRNSSEMKAELSRLREQFWEMKKELLHYKNMCQTIKESEDIFSREENLESEDESEAQIAALPASQDDDQNGQTEKSPLLREFEQTRLDEYMNSSTVERETASD
jgi:cell division protein ZapA (FtsZ GTPase activity inhibitor)